MAEPTARELKVAKAHGIKVVCPCGNDTGFTPNWEESKYTHGLVLHCPACNRDFCDDKYGPFTQICPGCKRKRAIEDKGCIICGESLIPEPSEPAISAVGMFVYCSNCREQNFRGSNQCVRCGNQINEDGDVIMVGSH